MTLQENKRSAQGRKAIPQTILRSGKHAQDIWVAALKHQYEKKGDRWVKKAEPGPSDPQAALGPATEPKSTDEPKVPTAGGKVARHDKEARAKAKEARQEDAQARRERDK